MGGDHSCPGKGPRILGTSLWNRQEHKGEEIAVPSRGPLFPTAVGGAVHGASIATRRIGCMRHQSWVAGISVVDGARYKAELHHW